MKNFYAVVANALTASSTNMFVWFAVTFWAYLQTQSVVVTSVLAGAYTVTVALSGFLLGSVVDRFHKKWVMLLSSVVSFGLYTAAAILYRASPPEAFTSA